MANRKQDTKSKKRDTLAKGRAATFRSQPPAQAAQGKEITVSENGPKSSTPFDVPTIKDLVELMAKHDLSEIDLREGELRIRLHRGPRGVVSMGVPMSAPIPVSSQAAPAAAAAVGTEKSKPAKNLLDIKSPAPGTFYAASGPDAPPYVRVGSKVTPTTKVCIIEAMKIMTEIDAECSGVITEVVVENQQPVEFGQVLFRVDPAG